MAVRYALRDLDYFRRTMKHPGRGTPHTIDSLAEASRVSRSTIGRLHSGERGWLDVNEAHRVAGALGVAVLVLFMPPASPNWDATSKGQHPNRKE